VPDTQTTRRTHVRYRDKATTGDVVLLVRQVRSAAGAKPKHRGALRALGLGRIGERNLQPDIASSHGMLRRVEHLVDWHRALVTAGGYERLGEAPGVSTYDLQPGEGREYEVNGEAVLWIEVSPNAVGVTWRAGTSTPRAVVDAAQRVTSVTSPWTAAFASREAVREVPVKPTEVMVLNRNALFGETVMSDLLPDGGNVGRFGRVDKPSRVAGRSGRDLHAVTIPVADSDTEIVWCRSPMRNGEAEVTIIGPHLDAQTVEAVMTATIEGVGIHRSEILRVVHEALHSAANDSRPPGSKA
jgi:large subunit ribosomal protein L30